MMTSDEDDDWKAAQRALEEACIARVGRSVSGVKACRPTLPDADRKRLAKEPQQQRAECTSSRNTSRTPGTGCLSGRKIKMCDVAFKADMRCPPECPLLTRRRRQSTLAVVCVTTGVELPGGRRTGFTTPRWSAIELRIVVRRWLRPFRQHSAVPCLPVALRSIKDVLAAVFQIGPPRVLNHVERNSFSASAGISSCHRE
jgi:hypothetical protein